jgi:hypothetical protein
MSDTAEAVGQGPTHSHNKVAEAVGQGPTHSHNKVAEAVGQGPTHSHNKVAYYKRLYKEFVRAINSQPGVIQEMSRTVMKDHFDDEEYWKHIFESLNFEDDFIKEFIDDINICYLIQYQALSEAIQDWLENNCKLSDNPEYLRLLVRYQCMSEGLLNKYLEKVPLEEIEWQHLATNQALSEEVIERFKDKWDWDAISMEQFLTLRMVTTHHARLNWHLLPMNMKTQYLFNDGFVNVFQEKPIWDNVGWMDRVTCDCLWQHLDRITAQGWCSILEHKDLPEDKLDDFVNNILPNTPKLDQTECWRLISTSQVLNKDMIDKYADKLHWDEVCMFQDLDWDMLERYHERVKLRYLSNNECLTDDLARKVKDNGHLFADALEEQED